MRTVLVVDDNEDYLTTVSGLLSYEYKVVSAKSLPEAQACFSSELSLALIDIRLQEDDPDNIDGLKLLEWMHNKNPKLRIIVMSAYTGFDFRARAYNLGASYFIEKIINISVLVESVKFFSDPTVTDKEIAQFRALSDKEIEDMSW